MESKTVIALALLVAAGAALVGRKLTAGIRNNNPGNLMDFGIPWRGLIGKDSAGRAIFDDALNGLRAMYIDLRTGFERDREDTVRKIINEWAPPSAGNPTAEYIAYVSRDLNVTPDTVLDLATVRVPLMESIIKFENAGQQPYPRELLEAAIRAA